VTVGVNQHCGTPFCVLYPICRILPNDIHRCPTLATMSRLTASVSLANFDIASCLGRSSLATCWKITQESSTPRPWLLETGGR
jgi:hypothetical protein